MNIPILIAYVMGFFLLILQVPSSQADDPFAHQKMEQLQLRVPERGSLAGEYGGTAFSNSDLTRGTYSLPLSLHFPEERGGMTYPLQVHYSPSSGISEWGMGISIDLSIKRFNAIGFLNFKDDHLISPWGELIQGADGNFYPKGFHQKIRVKFDSAHSKTVLAYMPDGTQLTFGQRQDDPEFVGIETDRGIYSWYLIEARDSNNRITQFHYERSPENWIYLKQVQYGGIRGQLQYQIDFSFEPLKIPFVDYRSTTKQTLMQRVSKIEISTLAAGSFQKYYHYQLSHQVTDFSASFYLNTFQKIYENGQSEPAIRFHYNDPLENLKKVNWKINEKLDSLFNTYGTSFLTANSSSKIDLDQNGLTSLELPRKKFGLLKQTETGFILESLPEETAENTRYCRDDFGSTTRPRMLGRLRGFNSPLEVIQFEYNPKNDLTTLYVCNREGILSSSKQVIEGAWKLGPLTRLVDLSRNGKPDLVKYAAGKLWIRKNISTSEKVEFSSEKVEIKLFDSYSQADNPKAIYFEDLNGDGILDLVAQYSRGFSVWMGQGKSTHQFSSPEKFGVFNKEDKFTLMDEDTQVLFQDLNGDGIPDLILHKTNSIRLFFLKGTKFIESDSISTFGAENRKWKQWLATPILGDFLGSGNLQMTVVADDKPFVLELNQPGTGLLRQLDDGKGNRLDFQYARAKPEKGIGSRHPVLSSLRVKTTGQKSKIFNYEFVQAQIHPLNQSLLGFNEVTLSEGPKQVLAQFIHDVETPTIPISSITTDRRQSGLKKIERFGYEKKDYLGIPYQRLIQEENGYLDLSGLNQMLVSKTIPSYQDEFCPAQTWVRSNESQLETQTEYEKPKLFDNHFICWAKRITLRGSHSIDSKLDFQHTLGIERNENGLPTKFYTLGDPSRILQTITYTPDFKVASLTEAGHGTTRYSYDAFSRLIQVQNPDGTTLHANGYDPIADLLHSLSHSRGAGTLFTRFFQYDNLSRLSHQWDNLYPSSSEDPLESLSYQFADAKKPAFTQVSQKIFGLKGSSQRIDGFLHSANGETLGDASWVQDHWIIRNLSLVDSNERAQTQFSQLLIPETFENVKVKDLFTSAQALSSQTRDFMGFILNDDKTYQTGVRGSGVTNTKVIQGTNGHELEFTYTENGQFTRTERINAQSQKTQIQNEAGDATLYQYDALGRLVNVILPDGKIHSVKFDSEGRVTEVNRSEIGKIIFRYDLISGLLKSKTFYNKTGEISHSLGVVYDEIGRKVQEIWNTNFGQTEAITDGRADASRKWTYTYFYDGKLPSGKMIPGQLGFLTSIQGPVYTQTITYRADGKMEKSEVNFTHWGQLTQDLSYQPDGSLKSQLLQFQSLSSAHEDAVSTSSLLEWEPNSYGLLGTMKVDAKPLFELTYDSFGKVSSLQWSEGANKQNADQFQYDPLTHQMQGFSRTVLGTQSENRWNFNQRGLIESEFLNFGNQMLNRNYFYSPPRFLISDQDDQGKRTYDYSSTGLLTAFTDGGKKSEIKNQSNSWDLNEGDQSLSYRQDDFGRVIQRGADQYIYGPNGRVEKVIHSDGSIVEYSYDEMGKRILKKKDGRIVEAYWDGMVLTQKAILKRVEINGITLGMLENNQFHPMATDFRGSVLEEDEQGSNFISTYGQRKKQTQNLHTKLMDYVTQGFDEDLQAYRMDHRDYDPKIKRFLTADPLFFEKIDSCLESAEECNLYGYAKGNPVSFVDPTGLSGILTLNSDRGGGGKLDGHSWITYRVDGTTHTESYGTWAIPGMSWVTMV